MITHKLVETMIDDLMRNQGWVRAVADRDLFRGKLPDRIYTRGEDVLVFELKPDNCLNGEIDKGIGQSLWYLPYKVKPYLVISESWVQQYKLVFSHLPELGVLQYSELMQISIVQRSNRNMAGLSAPSHLTMRLTRSFLWSFLKKVCPEDGYFSLDWVEEAIQTAYPLVMVYRPAIARIMTNLGYGRVRYDENLEQWVPFGKEYPRLGKGKPHFHVILNKNKEAVQ